jgi:hypothetical protein
MADNSGFPYCTKWKNYRYPLTRLKYSIGHKVVDDGYFDTAPLDIWISDDYFLMDLETEYVVTMTAATYDLCKSLKRPTVFIDGTSGQTEITSGGTNPFIKTSSSDSIQLFDVVSSLASTVSSTGNNQTLYTIAPGLHFGFTNTSASPFGTGDRSGWVMSESALNGVPKVMDGTYTCWYKLPTDAGDTVVTEMIPNGIANKSMNIMWNANRHIGKRATTAPNCGQSIILQGSVDGAVWTDIVKLMDDIDTGVTMFTQIHWDSNALDGEDFPFKRLKFEFETGGTEIEYHPHQFIQVNITPN